MVVSLFYVDLCYLYPYSQNPMEDKQAHINSINNRIQHKDYEQEAILDQTIEQNNN